MEILTPFSYVFGSEIVTEDLSELKTNTCFANGKDQGKKEYTENPFTILNKYDYSKKILTDYFHKFIDEAFGYECKFRITTSWMTKIGKGESVHFHNHVNSIWSGVFYFDEYTDKSCALQFRNPIGAQSPLSIGKCKNNVMTKDVGIQPEQNLLLIFPSWIQHYSQPNEEKERCSLAFNFMPEGLIGQSDSSYNPEWMV